VSTNTAPKRSVTEKNYQSNEKSSAGPRTATPIDGGYGPKPRKSDVKHVKEFNAIVRSVYDSLADHSSAIEKPRWMKEADRPRGYLSWPSTWTISNESGASRRSVHYALRKLIAAGYIECVLQSKGGQPKDIRQKDPELRAAAKNLRPTSAYLVFRTPQALRGTFEKNRAKTDKSTAQALHTILSEERTSQKSGGVSDSKSESSPPPRTREALPPETNGGGDACDKHEQIPDPPTDDPLIQQQFAELEALVATNEPLNCAGRRTILRMAAKHGFTLRELGCLYEQSGMDRAGGMVDIAKRWPAESQNAKRRRAEESPFEAGEIKAYLDHAANLLSGKQMRAYGEIAVSLRTLARAEEHANDLEDLERHLTVLEEKMVAVAQSTLAREVWLTFRAEIDSQLSPYSHTIPAEQLSMLERRYLHARVLQEVGLPRLSLFFMTHKANSVQSSGLQYRELF
jgi:hypothetical protein